MSQNHMICCCYSNRSQQWALARWVTWEGWRTPSQRARASWFTHTNTHAAKLRMLLRAQVYRLQRREGIATSDLFLDAFVHICTQNTFNTTFKTEQFMCNIMKADKKVFQAASIHKACPLKSCVWHPHCCATSVEVNQARTLAHIHKQTHIRLICDLFVVPENRQ